MNHTTLARSFSLFNKIDANRAKKLATILVKAALNDHGSKVYAMIMKKKFIKTMKTLQKDVLLHKLDITDLKFIRNMCPTFPFLDKIEFVSEPENNRIPFRVHSQIYADDERNLKSDHVIYTTEENWLIVTGMLYYLTASNKKTSKKRCLKVFNRLYRWIVYHEDYPKLYCREGNWSL